jgi:hypothetical protein
MMCSATRPRMRRNDGAARQLPVRHRPDVRGDRVGVPWAIRWQLVAKLARLPARKRLTTQERKPVGHLIRRGPSPEDPRRSPPAPPRAPSPDRPRVAPGPWTSSFWPARFHSNIRGQIFRRRALAAKGSVGSQPARAETGNPGSITRAGAFRLAFATGILGSVIGKARSRDVPPNARNAVIR